MRVPLPTPLLVALDTSTDVGSVAVSRDGKVLAQEMIPEQRRQAALLVPALEAALGSAGVDRREVEGVVVGRGPGSFTGVRIAAATARGLAMALECPLWAWSSLAGAAMAPDPHPRYVLFHARADRVYGACYRFHFNAMEELVPPRACTMDELLEGELPPDVRFCGTGALAHLDLLEEAGHPVLPPPAGVPTAVGLLRVHALHPEAPPLSPESRWEPEYLRASSAEREARTGGGGGSRKPVGG